MIILECSLFVIFFILHWNSAQVRMESSYRKTCKYIKKVSLYCWFHILNVWWVVKEQERAIYNRVRQGSKET
jgi:hypothetical protein